MFGSRPIQEVDHQPSSHSSFYYRENRLNDSSLYCSNCTYSLLLILVPEPSLYIIGCSVGGFFILNVFFLTLQVRDTILLYVHNFRLHWTQICNYLYCLLILVYMKCDYTCIYMVCALLPVLCMQEQYQLLLRCLLSFSQLCDSLHTTAADVSGHLSHPVLLVWCCYEALCSVLQQTYVYVHIGLGSGACNSSDCCVSRVVMWCVLSAISRSGLGESVHCCAR